MKWGRGKDSWRREVTDLRPTVLEEVSLQILESSQSKAKVVLKLMIMSQELKSTKTCWNGWGLEDNSKRRCSIWTS